MWREVYTVTSCAPVAEASRLMGDMRIWLDRRRVVPVAFHCHDRKNGVEIEISFDKHDDATAFAEEFSGVAVV